MDITEVYDRLEGIAFPPDQKRTIVQLIETKINYDMKEVIAKLTQVEQNLEVKLQMTQDKIQMVHDKLSNEIKTVYWVIGIAMAVILFVVARK